MEISTYFEKLTNELEKLFEHEAFVMLQGLSDEYGRYLLLTELSVIRSMTGVPDDSPSMHDQLATLRADVNIPAPMAFIGVTELKERVTTLRYIYGDEGGGFRRLIEDLDGFIEEYSKYNEQPREAVALGPLIALSNSILANTTMMLRTVRSIQMELRPSKPIPDQSTSIAISLAAVKRPEHFASRLTALCNLYEELAQLTKVSTAEYPLETVFIESGSFFTELMGHKMVIALMTSFLTFSAKYAYKNYSDGGKLEILPKKVEAIENVLKLSESLRESGIPTENMNEEIKKAAIKVAEQLNVLLQGQPSIEVNDEKYSVGDNIEQRFLEQAEKLQIEHQNPPEQLEDQSEETRP